MKNYMKKEKMPWLAIDYHEKKHSGMKKFGGDGVPNLMLIDRQGKQIARSCNTEIGSTIEVKSNYILESLLLLLWHRTDGSALNEFCQGRTLAIIVFTSSDVVCPAGNMV